MSIPRVSDKTIDMEKSSSSTNLLKGEDGQRSTEDAMILSVTTNKMQTYAS